MSYNDEIADQSYRGFEVVYLKESISRTVFLIEFRFKLLWSRISSRASGRWEDEPRQLRLGG